MDHRHLAMTTGGWTRLRSQLSCDVGEVVDVLRAGESLDGCAARTRLLLSQKGTFSSFRDRHFLRDRPVNTIGARPD